MSGIYGFSDKWKYVVKIIFSFSLLIESNQAIADGNVQTSELLSYIPSSQQKAENVLVDISNNLAFRILIAHSNMRNNRHNLLFSPWELMNVVVALYEATDGNSAKQIAQGVQLPFNSYFVRLGYHDVYRKLKMCCPNIGVPLTSLEFSSRNITISKQYEYILHLYGFGIEGLSGTLVATTAAPCETIATSTTTRIPPVTAAAPDVPCKMPTKPATTEKPTTEPPCEETASTTITIPPCKETTITTEKPTTEPPCEETAPTTTTESPCGETTTITTTKEPTTTSTTTTTTTTTRTKKPTTMTTTRKHAKPTTCKCHKKPKRDVPYDSYVQFFTQQYDTPTPKSNTFQSQELFNYYSQFRIAVLECNLATPGTSLLILLPDYGVSGIDAVGSLLQKESLREIRSKLTSTWVKAQIPNFQIHEKTSFAKYLKKMGIRDIFKCSNAIFRLMANETDVYVKSITQVNDLDINGLVPNGYLNPNYELPFGAIPFIADRPFFFIIIHKSLGMAIMAGRVSNLES